MTMRLRSAGTGPTTRSRSPDLMREELEQALVEALYELEILPRNREGAIVGIYAVMDDLQEAMRRTEALDRRSA